MGSKRQLANEGLNNSQMNGNDDDRYDERLRGIRSLFLSTRGRRQDKRYLSRQEIESIIYREARKFSEGKMIGEELDKIEELQNEIHSDNEGSKYDLQMKKACSKNENNLKILGCLKKLQIFEDEFSEEHEFRSISEVNESEAQKNNKTGSNKKSKKDQMNTEEMLKMSAEGIERYQVLSKKYNNKIDGMKESYQQKISKCDKEISILKNKYSCMVIEKKNIEMEKAAMRSDFEEIIMEKEKTIHDLDINLKKEIKEAEKTKQILKDEERLLQRESNKMFKELTDARKEIEESQNKLRSMDFKINEIEAMNSILVQQVKDAKNAERAEKEKKNKSRLEVEDLYHSNVRMKMKIDSLNIKIAELAEKDRKIDEMIQIKRQQDDLLRIKEREINRITSEVQRLKMQENVEKRERVKMIDEITKSKKEKDDFLRIKEEEIVRLVSEVQILKMQDDVMKNENKRLKETGKRLKETVTENDNLKATIKDLNNEFYKQNIRYDIDVRNQKRVLHDSGSQTELTVTDEQKKYISRYENETKTGNDKDMKTRVNISSYICELCTRKDQIIRENQIKIAELQAENNLFSQKIPKLEEINKNCVAITEQALEKSEKFNQEKIKAQLQLNHLMKGGSSQEALQGSSQEALQGSSQMVLSDETQRQILSQESKVMELSKDWKEFGTFVHETLEVEKAAMRKLMIDMQVFENKLDFERSQKAGLVGPHGPNDLDGTNCHSAPNDEMDLNDQNYQSDQSDQSYQGYQSDQSDLNCQNKIERTTNNARLQIMVKETVQEKKEAREKMVQTLVLLNASRERERKLKRRIKILEKLLQVNKFTPREENLLKNIKTMQKSMFRMMNKMKQPLPEMIQFKEMITREEFQMIKRTVRRRRLKAIEGSKTEGNIEKRKVQLKTRTGDSNVYPNEANAKRYEPKCRASSIDFPKTTEVISRPNNSKENRNEDQSERKTKDKTYDKDMQKTEQRNKTDLSEDSSNDHTTSGDEKSTTNKSDDAKDSTIYKPYEREDVTSSDEDYSTDESDEKTEEERKTIERNSRLQLLTAADDEVSLGEYRPTRKRKRKQKVKKFSFANLKMKLKMKRNKGKLKRLKVNKQESCQNNAMPMTTRSNSGKLANPKGKGGIYKRYQKVKVKSSKDEEDKDKKNEMKLTKDDSEGKSKDEDENENDSENESGSENESETENESNSESDVAENDDHTKVKAKKKKGGFSLVWKGFGSKKKSKHDEKDVKDKEGDKEGAKETTAKEKKEEKAYAKKLKKKQKKEKKKKKNAEKRKKKKEKDKKKKEGAQKKNGKEKKDDEKKNEKKKKKEETKEKKKKKEKEKKKKKEKEKKKKGEKEKKNEKEKGKRKNNKKVDKKKKRVEKEKKKQKQKEEKNENAVVKEDKEIRRKIEKIKIKKEKKLKKKEEKKQKKEQKKEEKKHKKEDGKKKRWIEIKKKSKKIKDKKEKQGKEKADSESNDVIVTNNREENKIDENACCSSGNAKEKEVKQTKSKRGFSIKFKNIFKGKKKISVSGDGNTEKDDEADEDNKDNDKVKDDENQNDNGKTNGEVKTTENITKEDENTKDVEKMKDIENIQDDENIDVVKKMKDIKNMQDGENIDVVEITKESNECEENTRVNEYKVRVLPEENYVDTIKLEDIDDSEEEGKEEISIQQKKSDDSETFLEEGCIQKPSTSWLENGKKINRFKEDEEEDDEHEDVSGNKETDVMIDNTCQSENKIEVLESTISFTDSSESEDIELQVLKACISSREAREIEQQKMETAKSQNILPTSENNELKGIESTDGVSDTSESEEIELQVVAECVSSRDARKNGQNVMETTAKIQNASPISKRNELEGKENILKEKEAELKRLEETLEKQRQELEFVGESFQDIDNAVIESLQTNLSRSYNNSRKQQKEIEKYKKEIAGLREEVKEMNRNDNMIAQKLLEQNEQNVNMENSPTNKEDEIELVIKEIMDEDLQQGPIIADGKVLQSKANSQESNNSAINKHQSSVKDQKPRAVQNQNQNNEQMVIQHTLPEHSESFLDVRMQKKSTHLSENGKKTKRYRQYAVEDDSHEDGCRKAEGDVMFDNTCHFENRTEDLESTDGVSDTSESEEIELQVVTECVSSRDARKNGQKGMETTAKIQNVSPISERNQLEGKENILKEKKAELERLEETFEKQKQDLEFIGQSFGDIDNAAMKSLQAKLSCQQKEIEKYKTEIEILKKEIKEINRNDSMIAQKLHERNEHGADMEDSSSDKEDEIEHLIKELMPENLHQRPIIMEKEDSQSKTSHQQLRSVRYEKQSDARDQQPSITKFQQPSNERNDEIVIVRQRKPVNQRSREPSAAWNEELNSSSFQLLSNSEIKQQKSASCEKPSTKWNERPSSTIKKDLSASKKVPSSTSRQQQSTASFHRPSSESFHRPSSESLQRPYTESCQQPSIAWNEEPSSVRYQVASNARQNEQSYDRYQKPSSTWPQEPSDAWQQDHSGTSSQKCGTKWSKEPSNERYQGPSNASEREQNSDRHQMPSGARPRTTSGAWYQEKGGSSSQEPSSSWNEEPTNSKYQGQSCASKKGPYSTWPKEPSTAWNEEEHGTANQESSAERSLETNIQEETSVTTLVSKAKDDNDPFSAASLLSRKGIFARRKSNETEIMKKIEKKKKKEDKKMIKQAKANCFQTQVKRPSSSNFFISPSEKSVLFDQPFGHFKTLPAIEKRPANQG